MDIYNKRDKILDLYQDMLTGDEEKNDGFLSLVKFEMWCCNSGLSGFIQDYNLSELNDVKQFANKHDFHTIKKMIAVVDGYINRYEISFIDSLSDDETKNLSQYDDDFYEIHDDFTLAIYNEFIT